MSATKAEKQWLPLESNPELMTRYLHSLGVGEGWSIVDVYGTDESLYAMLPQPVLAIMLLYPITDASEQFNRDQAQEIKNQTVPEEQKNAEGKVFWLKQTISNACGTIALIHSVLNNRDFLPIQEDSFFGKFFQDSQNKDGASRGELLETNDQLEVEHQSLAHEAQSDVSHAVNDNLHFISFVHVENYLWELDGRKRGPICHGSTNPSTFVADAMKVVEQFMQREPNDVRFSLVALAQGDEEFVAA